MLKLLSDGDSELLMVRQSCRGVRRAAVEPGCLAAGPTAPAHRLSDPRKAVQLFGTPIAQLKWDDQSASTFMRNK